MQHKSNEHTCMLLRTPPALQLQISALATSRILTMQIMRRVLRVFLGASDRIHRGVSGLAELVGLVDPIVGLCQLSMLVEFNKIRKAAL